LHWNNDFLSFRRRLIQGKLCLQWVLVGGLLLLVGCAARPETGGRGQSLPSSSENSNRELEALRPGLKTHEDSLVLDLLLGFRSLRLGVATEGQGADDVLRGRRAYDELEIQLRQGGVGRFAKNDEIFSLGDGDKLSLSEVLNIAHRNAQKSVLGSDLDKARSRNHEIVLNRQLLSYAIEDALWSLALIDALESPGLPVATKRKLRSLHEAYLNQAPHAEIIRQVNGVLAEIPDEKLRQQLKKLANRAWERDRRTVSTDERMLERPSEAKPFEPANPPQDTGLAESAVTPSLENPPAPVNGTADQAQVDSLIRLGQYLPALASLESMDSASQGEFIRDRRQRAGERYCDEKRRSAADNYKKARSAKSNPEKLAWLRKTNAVLDSCLFYFPQTSVGAKVKRNREMVQAEIQKLNP